MPRWSIPEVRLDQRERWHRATQDANFRIGHNFRASAKLDRSCLANVLYGKEHGGKFAAGTETFDTFREIFPFARAQTTFVNSRGVIEKLITT